MKAGSLRHSVILQSPGGTRDTSLERTTTWTDVATVRARIEPLSGREEFLAAQRQATTTHLITIRHSSLVSALDASWRVAFGARVFTIDNIRNVDERSREMDLLCTEGKRRE